MLAERHRPFQFARLQTKRNRGANRPTNGEVYCRQPRPGERLLNRKQSLILAIIRPPVFGRDAFFQPDKVEAPGLLFGAWRGRLRFLTMRLFTTRCHGLTSFCGACCSPIDNAESRGESPHERGSFLDELAWRQSVTGRLLSFPHLARVSPRSCLRSARVY